MNAFNDKIWVGWLAFIFVIVHFGFIIVYAMPGVFISDSVQAFSRPYVEPIFTQKWSMFAPCPTVNSEISAQFYFEDDTTDWIYLTEDAREKHRCYRASHHAELVLAESNLTYWLGLDLADLGIEIGQEFPGEMLATYQKGYSYFKVKNYLSGNARSLFQKSLLMARIRFDLEDVVSQKQGVLELPPFYY